MHFNPRSHERSDVRYSVFIGPSVISIHAPTRGATSKAVGCASTKSNFNPRSHERSDQWSFRLNYFRQKYFNPRSHVRSDAFFFFDFPALTISIHAPTRGATYYRSFVGRNISISIHAPTRGATHSGLMLLHALQYFNPRSHERSDSNIAQKICLFLYNTDNKYIIR